VPGYQLDECRLQRCAILTPERVCKSQLVFCRRRLCSDVG
jgi:hypothetical protein